ncbi:MAG: hypothetical protein EXQ52_01160 [Bryobacterales bacterium]|nr:hypothetical protein [Bryobacterales bacterium]
MTRRGIALCLLAAASSANAQPPRRIAVKRLSGNPIITEKMLPGDDGGSINGPSLIRVPAWVTSPRDKYYLYFAHHARKYIRMAYADRLEGPWKIHDGGVVKLEDQSTLTGHLASPEAVVDEENKKIVLFYHGHPPAFRRRDKTKAEGDSDPEAGQKTAAAVSSDGLQFCPTGVIVAPAYLRVFRDGGQWYGMAGRGSLLRSPELGKAFEAVSGVIGPDIEDLVDPVRLGEPGARSGQPKKGPDRYSIRHVGVDTDGDRMWVYFSCVGHQPERILATSVKMTGDPGGWKARGVIEVLRPETDWEGAGLPLAYSKGGRSKSWERGLRDPAIFRESGKIYLLYASAGEHGIGIAQVVYEAR